MCLILFALEVDPKYRLLLAANRDEFYERPAQPLAAWQGQPQIMAGRDLQGGGTWLGVTRSGRMAAVTNYRNPGMDLPQAPSRGFLVRDFLAGEEPPERYLSRLASKADRYNGFNLIVGDLSGLWYFSNRRSGIRRVEPGIYGLSNHLLDSDWPKVRKGKAGLHRVLKDGKAEEIDTLLDLLFDRSPAPDDLLPDTGVGLEWERVLSPIFITSRTYGTRCSSVIRVSRRGEVTFVERSFQHIDGKIRSGKDRRFDFTASPLN